MKIKNFIIILLSALAIVFLWLFLSEREKARRKDDLIDKLSEENSALKKGYLSLLEKYLTTQNKISPDVIVELQRLKSKIDRLETEVHIELNSVIKLVEQGQGVKGIKDLAKIVENKLKDKAKNDQTFKKKPMLHNLLEHAFNCQWISSSQFENGLLLKEIRNKESHELAVREEPLKIGMAIFTGIDIIYSLDS